MDIHELSSELRSLADEQLGPSCTLLLNDPALVVIASARIRKGMDHDDAVLSVAFEHVRTEPQVATEFFDYFLDRIVFSGRPIPPQIRKLHDTVDLVNSVVKDVWGDLEGIQFLGRRQFMSYLLQRYQWKIHEKLDRANAAKRREDMQVSVELDVAGGDPSEELTASRIVSERELVTRLEQKLQELPERERALIEARRKGATNSQLASEFGLAEQSVRKALSRARDRLNELLATV